MLGDPVSDAFGEGHVVERLGELAGVALDLDEFVDVAGVVDAADAEKTNVEGRKLRVFQPCAPEKVAPADAEVAYVCRCFGCGTLNFEGEFWCGALVCVENENPRMAEREL